MNRFCLLLALLSSLPGLGGEALSYKVQRVLVRPEDMRGSRSFWAGFRRVFTGESPSDISWGRPMSVVRRGDLLAVADAAGAVWLAGGPKGSGKPERLRPPEGPFSPIGLALSGSTLFASDTEAGTVWAYDLLTRKWEALPARFVRPTGLYYADDRGTLLIVDTGAHALLGWGGSILQTVCDQGLNFPTAVAEGRDHRLFIADSLDHEVEVRSWTGERLAAFGASGDATGYFSFIRGIALDRAGHIYVSDVQKNWVQVFSPDGTLLSVLGEGLGLSHPSYIAFEGDSLWVADTYNRRVIEIGVR